MARSRGLLSVYGALCLAASVGLARELPPGFFKKKGTYLLPENWRGATDGKVVFIKFMAPWCSNCAAMKPAWDKLVEANFGNQSRVVATVDCTKDGKPICDRLKIDAFPTLKHGIIDDAGNHLEDYRGGRDFDSLKAFADTLVPPCNPRHIRNCDEAEASQIEAFLSWSAEKLQGKVRKLEAEEAAFNGKYGTEVAAHKKRHFDEHHALKVAYEDKVREIKRRTGYDTMKLVQRLANVQ